MKFSEKIYSSIGTILCTVQFYFWTHDDWGTGFVACVISQTVILFDVLIGAIREKTKEG